MKLSKGKNYKSDVLPLVFVEGFGSGVIYLRILPTTTNIIHGNLDIVLQTYSQEELARAFVVVEPSGHRFRKLYS